MSSRERWTVYPLLFLTLGIVTKDKITRWVNADVVVCKTLVVTDRNDREQVVLSSNQAGGLLKTGSNTQGGVNVFVGHTESGVVGLTFTDAHGNMLPVRQPNFVVPRPVRRAAPRGASDGELDRSLPIEHDSMDDEQPASP